MTKKEAAQLDKMLDRWEKETKEGRDRPGKPSDPRPEWDHIKYMKTIYSNRKYYRD